MNDPIADMLTRIRNAGSVGKDTVVLPYSNLKWAILELLKKEGFVKDISKKGKGAVKNILIELLFDKEGKHVINDVNRVSKYSRRIYKGVKDLKPFKSGRGTVVITTPKGIMTDSQAKKEKIGGEVLFKIW